MQTTFTLPQNVAAGYAKQLHIIALNARHLPPQFLKQKFMYRHEKLPYHSHCCILQY